MHLIELGALLSLPALPDGIITAYSQRVRRQSELIHLQGEINMSVSSLVLRFAVVASIGVTMCACATKRYPIATPLAQEEVALMTCKDISLELIRADQIEKQINETGSMDGRSVAGFLGDFGIGNGMAKDEARKALASRRAGLLDAYVKKNCIAERSAEAPAAGAN